MHGARRTRRRRRGLTTASTSPQALARSALCAVGRRAEDIREIAPHAPLVGHSRQPARARQDAQQGHLGQAHGRRAVVDQDDLVAGQGQLVPAAGAAPLHAAMNFRPECPLASSMPLRVSLVNLQKLTFQA